MLRFLVYATTLTEEGTVIREEQEGAPLEPSEARQGRGHPHF
jgi:hypothetical protein